jgi:hypothetical protein
MAVYGVNSTLARAGGLASQTARGIYDARVKCIVDSYEASSLATASEIYMGNTLPAGARIQEIILAWDALQATCQLSVGDAAASMRYISAVIASTVGFARLSHIDGFDYVIGTASNDNQIVIKTSGASAATGTIKIAIFYTQD